MSVATILRSGSGVDTSDATAKAEYILTGYSGWVNDKLIQGTMPDNKAFTKTIACGQSVTIPKGYHNGGGRITVKSLKDQTPGNATAAQILTGKTLWVNGARITGTMPNRGAISYSLPANGSYTIPNGYHNGSGKVTQSLSTQGGWTVTPGTSNITACAANKWTIGAIYCAGASTLVARNIKKGVTIFGVTGTYQGF